MTEMIVIQNSLIPTPNVLRLLGLHFDQGNTMKAERA